jgi:hypothetical protein
MSGIDREMRCAVELGIAPHGTEISPISEYLSRFDLKGGDSHGALPIGWFGQRCTRSAKEGKPIFSPRHRWRAESAEPQRSPSASSRRAGLPEFADFLPNAGNRFTRGLGHQPTIVGYRGQAEAHPDHARRIGRLAAMDAGVNPTLAARSVSG